MPDVVAVHIGYGKDELGFRCSIMEHPVTGKRYLAYDPETWFERAQHIKTIEAMGKRIPETTPDRVGVE